MRRPDRRLRRHRAALRALLLGLLLLASGCSLMQRPPQLQLPTPEPFRPENLPPSDLPLVQNPTSSAVPAVDPVIGALLQGQDGVSRQNLFAYVQTLENFGTRHTLSEPQGEGFGIGAARIWIHNEFNRVGNGRLEVRFDDFPTTFNGFTTNQRNVVAVLPGRSQRPQVLLLTAHYDSRVADPTNGTARAPGANDNASGVAVLLETARLLSSREWNHTVMFVAFAAEEQGTFGSRHFVQNVVIFNDMPIQGVLNNDIVGGRPGIPQSLRAFALGPDTSIYRQFTRYLNFIGALYVPQMPLTLVDALDREGRYSDHREFVNVGLPAVRLTESEEDFTVQHTGLDTADRLDYDYLARVTQFNLAVAANFAGAPDRPEPPSIARMADAGAFILTWQPDRSIAGYALSFRPLGSDGLPPFRFVNSAQAGNVALTGLDPTVTYAISIAAIDLNGRMSLPSPEIVVTP